MTAIIGMSDSLSKAVWLASDSGISDSDDTGDVGPYSKIFHTGNEGVEIVVGMSGNLRMGQIVEHVVMPQLKETPYYSIAERWCVTTFYHKIHDAFVEYGLLKDDAVFRMDSAMLVGIQHQLFLIDTNFEVVQASRGYDAIGSGRQIVMGALHASLALDSDAGPETHMRRALIATCDHMPNIKKPFVLTNTKIRKHTFFYE